MQNEEHYTTTTEWRNWLSQVSQIFKRGRFENVLTLKISDHRPHIRISIFDVDFVVLLDTGATVSIAGGGSAKLLGDNDVPILPSRITAVRTADDNKQVVQGVISLPLLINNVAITQDFLYVPSIDCKLILGMDFMRKNDVQISFANNHYCFGDDAVNYPFLDSIVGVREFSNLDHLQQLKVDEVKTKFKCLSSEKISRTSVITHTIDTGNNQPIKQRAYPLSPYMQSKLNEELDKMLELGVVKPSRSAWSSPVLLVKKKTGEFRFCFDGRKLNSVTLKDVYPLPRVDSILNRLRDAKYLSSIDLKSAFWQIPLDTNSCEKTAFTVLGRGLFEFNVLPFGLHNSAATQQRLMDNIFGPALEPYIFVYLDDIIIVSSDFNKHIELLNVVFDRLEAANLTINVEKCEFCRPSLRYLGYMVDESGLHTDPEKIEAMVSFQKPRTATEMKRFIGLISWYRRFIKDFSSVSSPLSSLLKGKRKSNTLLWNNDAEKAFENIKNYLVSAPILISPNFAKPFIVQSDASDYGLGGVLVQLDENNEEHVISYASRTLTRPERNYTVVEKECLALIFAIEKFRPYIEGTKFTCMTDCYSLLWLKKLENPSGRLARWILKLDQFDFELVHRKGSQNVVPDALSRDVPKIDEIVPVADDVWYIKKCEEVESNPGKFPGWKLEDGKLYKYLVPRSHQPSDVLDWKLVIPENKREEILYDCHDAPTSGHLGTFKTINRVTQFYYWPSMRKEITNYVRNCKICGAQKASNAPVSGLMGKQKNIDRPFQMLAVDLIGPLPKSKSGNCHLLVVVDWLTKFVLVHPSRRATAEDIVRFFENEVFLKFGVPQIILADNGSQFVSRKFKDLTDSYGVQKIWFNARYHPQANYCERSNRTIGTMIRSYIKDNQHNLWDQHIFEIAYAINSSVHDSTKYSPNFLNFGRIIPIKGSFYNGLDANFEAKCADGTYLADNLQRLPEIFDKAKKYMDNAYQRSFKYYNLRRRDVSFNVGDLVWKKNNVLSNAGVGFSAKLAPKFILCKVIKVCSRVVYELESVEGKYVGRYHVKDLKPYLGDGDISD